MSLPPQLILAEKYSMRPDIQELASELNVAKGTLMNQISGGTLGIKTYMDGGKRWADVRDVAAHHDRMREKAEA